MGKEDYTADGEASHKPTAKFTSRNLWGAKIITTRIHCDLRGYFQESLSKDFLAGLRIPTDFPQENLSHSNKGTFRGMHFQYPTWQGKLIQVIGEVIDFWVDLREKSFGQVGFTFLKDPSTLVYVPEGFAHGFYALEDSYFMYHCTKPYVYKENYTLDFEQVDIIREMMDGLGVNPKLSAKDAKGHNWDDVRAILKGNPDGLQL